MTLYTSELIDLDPARKDAATEQLDALTPLDERLRIVLDQIPLAVRRKGLTLEMIRERLKGRKRGKAHCGELGQALFKLGYERHRDWRSGSVTGYGTRWFPRGYGPDGRTCRSNSIQNQLREARPDLFPNRQGRIPRWIMDARRQAAAELGLI